MLKITILCVGKIKEKYFSDAVAEYKKRLGRYCRMEIIEVADEKAPEDISAAMEEEIKRKEGERLLKSIREGDYIIALAIEGEQLSSVELAKKLDKLATRGISQIVFVIGGSLGLSKEVLARAKEKISFSKMTFPHQLMRVILLEQVYRAFRINQGEPYHK